MQKEQNKTGVWIDFDKAFIVQISQEKKAIKKVESNIEHFHVHGGSRSKIAYGPQNNVSESKLLARKQQQQNEFFSEVRKEINPKNELVIFGPAEAKIGLKKALLSHSSFKQKNIAIETADNMTENQMKAWVHNYNS